MAEPHPMFYKYMQQILQKKETALKKRRYGEYLAVAKAGMRFLTALFFVHERILIIFVPGKGGNFASRDGIRFAHPPPVRQSIMKETESFRFHRSAATVKIQMNLILPVPSDLPAAQVSFIFLHSLKRGISSVG